MEVALDQKLSRMFGTSGKPCNWVVHYHTWIPTFDPGEYERTAPQSGIHCLIACCQDPSCVGLALESNEKYQCYKYSTMPSGLNAAEGIRLGDSQWLLHRGAAWSIFIKAESDSEAWQHAMDPPQTCNWAIVYDKWIPSFDPGEYMHGSYLGGARCLEACCKDPTCSGLAFGSTEKFQCYKYSSLPAELDGLKTVPLGDGQWLLNKRSAWSIFIKGGVVSSSGGAAPGSQSFPTPSEKARTVDVRMVSAGSPTAYETCDWTVFYDKWLPSFEPGEYEPNNDLGGSHCLEACCKDPTCLGLALESTEKFQCYRYRSLPGDLQTSEGQSLGDGEWLLKKKSAWSIFVKTVVARPPVSDQKPNLFTAALLTLAPRQPEPISAPMVAQLSKSRELGKSQGYQPIYAQSLVFSSLAVVIILALYTRLYHKLRLGTWLGHSHGSSRLDSGKKMELPSLNSGFVVERGSY